MFIAGVLFTQKHIYYSIHMPYAVCLNSHMCLYTLLIRDTRNIHEASCMYLSLVCVPRGHVRSLCRSVRDKFWQFPIGRFGSKQHLLRLFLSIKFHSLTPSAVCARIETHRQWKNHNLTIRAHKRLVIPFNWAVGGYVCKRLKCYHNHIRLSSVPYFVHVGIFFELTTVAYHGWRTVDSEYFRVISLRIGVFSSVWQMNYWTSLVVVLSTLNNILIFNSQFCTSWILHFIILCSFGVCRKSNILWKCRKVQSSLVTAQHWARGMLPRKCSSCSVTNSNFPLGANFGYSWPRLKRLEFSAT